MAKPLPFGDAGTRGERSRVDVVGVMPAGSRPTPVVAAFLAGIVGALVVFSRQVGVFRSSQTCASRRLHSAQAALPRRGARRRWMVLEPHASWRRISAAA